MTPVDGCVADGTNVACWASVVLHNHIVAAIAA
jgi:hypothetical protein